MCVVVEQQVKYLTSFHLGNRRGAADVREGVWRDDRPQASMWMAGHGCCSVLEHDQRLCWVRVSCMEALRFTLTMICSICLTKLDILDRLSEIKIGIAYKHHGRTLASFPGARHRNAARYEE